MSLDTIQNYIIGIIVCMVVITGGIFIVGTFYSKDSTIDPSGDIARFNRTLDKSAELTSSVEQVGDSISSVENNAGLLGWLNALVGSAFNSLKIIGSSLGFMTTAIEDGASLFGIPAFLVTLLLLIVVVIIVFAIWSAILKV